MIEVNKAWSIVRSGALKALQLKADFHSRRTGVPYHIIEVHDSHMFIHRNGEPSRLSQINVETAIQHLNDNNGLPLHYELFLDGSVANETTIVFFHPQLAWTEDGTQISEI